ncbi:hypothetical protein ACFWMP_26025 [Paenibacillus sp. NPDC058367]|uniref:hypothetical protein n=1 Tax=Paenibacillus sp. NPDC058367 TaxID=3346460 RepID=UPI00364A0662
MASKFWWYGVTVKEVNVVNRPNKTPLIFIDLIDPSNFESTGQYMFLPEDRAEQAPRKGEVVDVYTKPGTYNGKPSFTFASIVPSKTVAASKVG